MFEKASRLKLRFNTKNGNLSAEDLWDIPLLTTNNALSLDDMAKELNRELKASQEESFVIQKTAGDEIVELKFELVKHVISVKLDEAEEARKAAENQIKKDRILEIIDQKKDEKLLGMSMKDLKKMVREL